MLGSEGVGIGGLGSKGLDTGGLGSGRALPVCTYAVCFCSMPAELICAALLHN